MVQGPPGILWNSEKEEMSCYGSITIAAHFLQYGFFCIAYLKNGGKSQKPYKINASLHSPPFSFLKHI